MKVENKKLVLVENTYHLEIHYNGNKYFFIANCFTNDNRQYLKTYKRGSTHWDCGKTLRSSEKKKIKKLIIESVEYNLNN